VTRQSATLPPANWADSGKDRAAIPGRVSHGMVTAT